MTRRFISHRHSVLKNHHNYCLCRSKNKLTSVYGRKLSDDIIIMKNKTYRFPLTCHNGRVGGIFLFHKIFFLLFKTQLMMLVSTFGSWTWEGKWKTSKWIEAQIENTCSMEENLFFYSRQRAHIARKFFVLQYKQKEAFAHILLNKSWASALCFSTHIFSWITN